MHGWSGCETCGGACAWEDPPEKEKEPEEDMDTDKLMKSALDNFVGEMAQDSQEMFWIDAHNTLVAINWMLEEQKKLGILTETTEALLTAAKWALDAEFSKGNRVVEEEADVAF